jgi:hypothetical protein
MPGLTERAGGEYPEAGEAVERARQAWQESMLRQINRLRADVQSHLPQRLAERCGGTWDAERIKLMYWGRAVSLDWPDLSARFEPDGPDCLTFDTAVLLYYLQTADGSPLADRWIGYRELPDGAFYANAFQGYSGNRMARTFGERPQAYTAAALSLGGTPIPDLPGLAYTFQPLPRIRLATILYPGDEEFPARGSVLFDAAASHYLPTDGLALLGSGLVSRLGKHEPGR